jgi:hypothetical protein
VMALCVRRRTAASATRNLSFAPGSWLAHIF